MDEEFDVLKDQMDALGILADADEAAMQLKNTAPTAVVQPNPVGVETAETLRGEIPFTPENPTNRGVVTNNTHSVVGTIQSQANMQAAAQVVKPSTTVASMQAPVQSVAPMQPAVKAATDAAPVFVNLAENAYQTQTDFLTLKDGEKTRVTLANLNFIRVYIHYVPGMGKFKCLSQYNPGQRWPDVKAACCKFPDPKNPDKTMNAKQRLLVPVIEYPVSKADGTTPIQGATPKLKMWDMNYLEEKDLIEILDAYKVGDDYSTIDLSSFDLRLSKGKSGEYSTISVTNIPSWRNQYLAGINAEIAKINTDFYNNAYKECARVIPIETIEQKLEQEKAANKMAEQISNQAIPDANTLGLNTQMYNFGVMPNQMQ